MPVTLNFIHEFWGWSFVGCPSRLGTITRMGPVTGIQWTIPATGTWIDKDDALALSEIIEDIFCWRTNANIPTNTVFFLNPSEDQVRQLKETLDR
jgi:hypothetical protein